MPRVTALVIAAGLVSCMANARVDGRTVLVEGTTLVEATAEGAARQDDTSTGTAKEPGAVARGAAAVAEGGKKIGTQAAGTAKKAARPVAETGKKVGAEAAEGGKKIGTQAAGTAKKAARPVAETGKKVGAEAAEGGKKVGAGAADGGKKIGTQLAGTAKKIGSGLKALVSTDGGK
jgi:hypothetical protein